MKWSLCGNIKKERKKFNFSKFGHLLREAKRQEDKVRVQTKETVQTKEKVINE